MRRLCVSLAVLAALFCAALYNTHSLHTYTQELITLLTQAEDCAVQGNWDAAAEKTDAALELWLEHSGHLHITLHHQNTDEILLSFQEVRQLIAYREDKGRYAAANAQLMTRISLMYEMEQLNLENLL